MSIFAVRSPVHGDGWTLPAGVFAYHEVLAAGTRIPSLAEALKAPA